MAQSLASRRTLLTHISHSLDHEATNAALPPSMALAFDGQAIDL